MKISFLFLTFIIFLLNTKYLFCEGNSSIDSLKLCIQNSKSNSESVNLLSKLSEKYSSCGEYKLANKYAYEGIQLATKKNIIEGLANCYNSLGISFNNNGKFPEALKAYFKALTYYERIKDAKGISNCFSNISIINLSIENYQEAIQYNLKAKKIREKINDLKGLANSISNLGNIYYVLDSMELSLDCQTKALDIRLKINDKTGLGISYTNIGNILFVKEDWKLALENYCKAILIFEQSNDIFNNAGARIGAGMTCIELKQPKQAAIWFNKSIEIAKQTGSKELIKNCYEYLYIADSIDGDAKGSFDSFRLFIAYRDSLINDENTKKVVQTQMQYEFDKKSASVKAAQEKKNLVLRSSKDRRQMTLIVLGGILILGIGFAVYILKNLRAARQQKRKIEEQKLVVEEQKLLVEEKQNEILDSIRYARRIQSALLPSEKSIHKVLNQKLFLLVIVFQLFQFSSKAVGDTTKAKIDSLSQIVKHAKHDSIKVNAYKAWANIIYDSNPKLYLRFSEKVENICSKHLEIKQKPDIERVFFKRNLSWSYNAKGLYYGDRGNLKSSTKFYFKALKIYEALKLDLEIARTFHNIGNVYLALEEYSEALKFYNKSIKLKLKLNDTEGLGFSYCNIGIIYENMKEFNKSLSHQFLSLNIAIKLKDRKSIAMSLNNIANNYMKVAKYDSSLIFYFKALEIKNQLGDSIAIYSTKGNIGNVYLLKGDFIKSKLYLLEAANNSVRRSDLGIARNAFKTLYQIEEYKGNYTTALSYYKLFISIRDKILNEENVKMIFETQMNYENDKKVASTKLKQEKIDLEEREIFLNQKFYLFLVIGVLVVIIGISITIFKRLRITNNQRKQIEMQKSIVVHQKEIVEEKQIEILDSIRYARRIQQALLPNESYVQKYLIKLNGKKLL